MTATDELRRMLDERGVEWDALSSKDGDRITRWKDANGRYVSALDCGETRYLADFYWGPTPQQAIEATLGRGTCEVEAENAKLRELVRVFYHCTTSGECDECPINGGSTVHLMPDTICGTIHDCMRGLGVEVE